MIWPESYECQQAQFEAIAHLIDQAMSIAICAHTSPDGDAIGSELALAEIIDQRWPGKHVITLLADDTIVPRAYAFLPFADRLKNVDRCDFDPDLFICVDLSLPKRLNKAQSVLERSSKVAVLDHHPGSDPFWDAGVVRADAAAAGVIVAEFASFVGCKLTPTMAQNLLCALVTDTGRFQYQNANSEAFAVASQLVEAGAQPAEIALNVYQSDRLSYIHLCAKVMGRITTFEQGKIAYSYATPSDFSSLGVDVSECDGLVDLVRSVEGAEVAVFLKEVEGNQTRGNLRSKTDLDISGVARELGGGGHAAAAGFTCDCGIDETCSLVLPKLRALYAKERPR